MAGGWIIKLGGQPCSSPHSLAESMGDYPFRDELPLWRRANSYECPRGEEVGRGYVLMQREYLDKLKPNEYHSLEFVDQFGTVKIKSLLIVSAKSMFGQAGESACPMLVELADRRLVMSRSSTNASYNRLIPAPPNPDVTVLKYYPESINGGALWTWQTLIDDLWGDVIDKVGSSLPLPISAASTPENLTFIGQSPWKAIHVVLAQLGCTTAYDPIADSFSVVHIGDTQVGLAKSVKNLKVRLLQDYDTNDKFLAANMPSQVRVFFPKTDKWRGIEKDTPRSANWEMDCFSRITVPTQVTGAKGVMPVVGDMWALVDRGGSVANQSALQNRANSIAQDVIANKPKLSRRVYSGSVSTILPGSEISYVTWRDYGDYDRNVGQITIVENKTWSRYYNESGWSIESESVQPVDIARKTYPNYPDLMQLVQVYDSYKPAGQETSAVSGTLPGDTPVSVKVFPGKVKLIRNNVETLDDCWLISMTDYGTIAGNTTLKNHSYYHGRLSGTAKSGGQEFPLYSIVPSESKEKHSYVRITETLIPGSSATGRLVKMDWPVGDWVDVDEDADDVILLDLYHDASAKGDESSEIWGWNEGLIGDVFPCYYDPEVEYRVLDDPNRRSGAYVILTQLPWAVRRFAKVTESGDGIALGESGDVEIYHKGVAGGENEPVASGVTVKGWALKWHHTAGIPTDKKVMIQWQPDQRRWWIEPLTPAASGVIMGRCEITENLCPEDGTAEVANAKLFNDCEVLDVSTMRNMYHHAVNTDDGNKKALFVYDCDIEDYVIIQVEKVASGMVESVEYDESYDSEAVSCSIKVRRYATTAIETCEQLPGYSDIALYWTEYVSDVRIQGTSDGCELQANVKGFCSFTDPSDEIINPDNWTTKHEMVKENVVVNVYDDIPNAELRQVLLELWVPCVGDESDAIVAESEECPPE